jgi:hypothetical protein
MHYASLTTLLTHKNYKVRDIFIYAINAGNQKVIQLTINYNNMQKSISTKIKPDQKHLIEKDILKTIKRRNFAKSVVLGIPEGKIVNLAKIPDDTIDFIHQSLQDCLIDITKAPKRALLHFNNKQIGKKSKSP